MSRFVELDFEDITAVRFNQGAVLDNLLICDTVRDKFHMPWPGLKKVHVAGKYV